LYAGDVVVIGALGETDFHHIQLLWLIH